MKPVSLGQQIEEIEMVLARHDSDVPPLVARGKMTHSQADFRRNRILAVLRTLNWLRDSERTIKQRLAVTDHA